MYKMKTSIIKSCFSEAFKSVLSNDIYLLSKDLSKNIWTQNIDFKANCYFNISDDNWLVTSNSMVLGNWIEDYNCDYSVNIHNLLCDSFEWNNKDVVWFCINIEIVIESSWLDFKKYWLSFLECEDDCPIVINSNNKKGALIFTPIGDFIKIFN